MIPYSNKHIILEIIKDKIINTILRKYKILNFFPGIFTKYTP